MYGETKPKNKEKKKEKEETIEKYRLSQGRMNNYKKEVKDRLTEKEDIDIMTINKIMKESTENPLKVKIKITKEKAEEKDKKWMTEQIRKEIKKRKEINRQQRKRKTLNLGEVQRTKNKSERTNKERNKKT